MDGHAVEHPGSHLAEVVTAVGPGLVDGGEHLSERGHSAPLLLRPVGACVEGTALGVEEHGHRPAAPPGQGGDGIHVDGVDVGPFLAVDLHAHEPAVHEVRRLRVLEGFVRHDVAPVACGVAHREQHRPGGAPGFGECIVTPGVPVDRVVGVLAEIGA